MESFVGQQELNIWRQEFFSFPISCTSWLKVAENVEIVLSCLLCLSLKKTWMLNMAKMYKKADDQPELTLILWRFWAEIWTVKEFLVPSTSVFKYASGPLFIEKSSGPIWWKNKRIYLPIFLQFFESILEHTSRTPLSWN